MKLIPLILLLPSLCFARSLEITGQFDDKDSIAINKNLRELDRRTSITTLRGQFRTKVGTFTSSGSTGNQSVSGLGFKPRTVVLVMGSGDASNFVAGLGFFTADDEVAALAFAQRDGGGGGDATGGLSTSASYAIQWSDVDGAAAGRATFVSMDVDGFTINWSVAQAQTIAYLAFE